MNIYRYITFSIIILLFSLKFISAQTLSDRDRLDALSAQFKIQEDLDLLEAINAAELNNWPLRGLIGLKEDGSPLYFESHNDPAAIATNTRLTTTNYGVDGDGMKMGIWECCNDGTVDGVIPRLTHQDLSGRVTVVDGTTTINSHATHVAGTMIGNHPSSPATKGMAFEATLDAYGILNSHSEMAAAAANTIADVDDGKLLISNHSYGFLAGWEVAGASQSTWYGGTASFVNGGIDPNFGAYTTESLMDDQVMHAAPYYLICKSAGNDASDSPRSQVQDGPGGAFVPYDSTIHPDPDGLTGFNCLPGSGTGKNIMTIGSVNGSKVVSSFSSRGPTLDGRVKPEICGIGEFLRSASSASNTSYQNRAGTSMSSPQVSGSLLLLQELYNDKMGFGSDNNFMKASTLKALALHTATDRGNSGPDYTYGYGVLNTSAAADVIDEITNPTSIQKSAIIESEITGGFLTYKFYLDSLSDLRVTMAYNDVPGTSLVNDLDIQILHPGPSIRPFVLDPTNPSSLAVRGDNDIDNVEYFGSINASDSALIVVFVDGSLHMGEPQSFSLIISGFSNQDCQSTIWHTTHDILSDTYTAADQINSSGKVQAGREVEYKTNGAVFLTPGFHAKANTSAGAGFFKTSRGNCN